MRILLILSACLLLSLPAFSANCDRILKKRDKRCGKKPDSRRCQKLTSKYQVLCEDGGSRKDYRAAKKTNRRGRRSDRKASKGKLGKKCDRIAKKMDKSCEKKPDGRRCARLTKKYADFKCDSAGEEDYDDEEYED
ncbi:MAG: hypothetical protein HOE90_03715 [Bacteriovoracaceae bacterium]|jgi:hypothetical protein|nr:hypothetical protein [Bacteriovoracaceae bacterium]